MSCVNYCFLMFPVNIPLNQQRQARFKNVTAKELDVKGDFVTNSWLSANAVLHMDIDLSH